MKKAEMTTEAPQIQSVDEAIDNYLKQFSALRKAKNYEAAVTLQDEFGQYIDSLIGDDRAKALHAYVHSI